MGDVLLEAFQTLALFACAIGIYANFKTINILMTIMDRHEDNSAKMAGRLGQIVDARLAQVERDRRIKDAH